MPTYERGGIKFYTCVRPTYSVNEFLQALRRAEPSKLELTPVHTSASHNGIYGIGRRSSGTKDTRYYWYLDASIPVSAAVANNYRGINTLIHPTIHGFITKGGMGAEHYSSEYTRSLEKKYSEFRMFLQRLKKLFPKIELVDEYTKLLKA